LTTCLASGVTDWISALSTLVIGVVGFLFGAWQWSQSRFRPTFEAYIDSPREAIEVRVRNRGRGAGEIARVAVVQLAGELFGIESRFRVLAYDHGPFRLPALSFMRLILNAPTTRDPFPDDVMVKLEWGHAKSTLLEPVEITGGLWGLPSSIPAGSEADS
jgi:hypothetical protein